MVRHRFPEEPGSELDQLVRRLTEAESERNKYIHSCWGGPTPEGQSARMKVSARKVKKGLRYHSALLGRSDLEAFVHQLEKLVSDLQFYDMKLRGFRGEKPAT